MSQKIKKSELDIGVLAVHPKYGEIELLDKIQSITDKYWLASDEENEIHIIDEADIKDYYYYG